MVAAETTTDRGIGYAAVLGLVAVGGALAMFLNPGSPVAGYGFAVAMVAGGLSVVAAQAF